MTYYDSDICDSFRRNPLVNPRTGRSIKLGGPTYNALVKGCMLAAAGMPPHLAALPEQDANVGRQRPQMPTLFPMVPVPVVSPRPAVSPRPVVSPRPAARVPVPAARVPVPATRVPVPVAKVPTKIPSPPTIVSPQKIAPTTTPLPVTDLVNAIWGVAQKQQRASEDVYQAKQIGRYQYYAVFDGHGGPRQMGSSHVANYARMYLHERLAKNLGYVDLSDREVVSRTIVETFVELDREMYDAKMEFGSTCTAILIDPLLDIIYQINLGDSRSILFTNQSIISATVDHDTNLESEVDRIEKAGGYVSFGRVVGVLLVTRAFGDFKLKNEHTPMGVWVPNKAMVPIYDPINGMVSAVPDIQIVDRRRVENFILTSDAPYEKDAFSDQDLVDLLARIREELSTPEDAGVASQIAELMVQEIYPRTSDDTTIIYGWV